MTEPAAANICAWLLRVSCAGLVAAAAPASLLAQHTHVTPDPAVPLPREFSNAVPEGARWKVRILRQGDREWPDPDRLRGLPPARERFASRNPRLPAYLTAIEDRSLQSIEASFSSGLRRELLRFGNGTEIERYLAAGLLMHRDPETGEIHLHAGGFSVTGPVWGTERFGELAWVSSSNYIGAAGFRGKPAFVFREYVGHRQAETTSDAEAEAAMRNGPAQGTSPVVATGVPAAEAGPGARILRTAFIDRETMLPLAWESEGEIWEYEMQGTGPAFRLPTEYRRELEAAREAVSRIQERFIVPQ